MSKKIKGCKQKGFAHLLLLSFVLLGAISGAIFISRNTDQLKEEIQSIPSKSVLGETTASETVACSSLNSKIK